MGKRAGQRAGRSAGFVTAKKVKGKKAKHETVHDEALPGPAAGEPRLGGVSHPGPGQVSPPVPSADPEAEHVGRLPLGPDDLDKLHALLVARRVRALRTSGELHRDESDLEEAVTQSAELMEKSTDRLMENAVVTEEEAERSLLEAIDAALARMDRGTYGICEECGERIALPRLLVLPEARWCIACAQDASRRR